MPHGFAGRAAGGARRRWQRLITGLVDQRLQFQSAPTVGVGRDVEGLKHVAFEGENAVGRGTVFQGVVRVGLATTIGPNSVIHGPVEIGRYCQFGASVGLYGRDHPTTLATTYLNQRLLAGAVAALATDDPVRIGHGVWIGHGAVALRGVTVGNGAVIGAGAVVTTDCPAYTVMVGNPARPIRSRIPDEAAALLEASGWWLRSPAELAPYRDAFTTDLVADPERGVELLTAMVADLQG